MRSKGAVAQVIDSGNDEDVIFPCEQPLQPLHIGISFGIETPLGIPVMFLLTCHRTS